MKTRGGPLDASTHGRRGLTRRSAELGRPRPRNLDDEVETVEKGSRKPVPIRREPLRRAGAFGGLVSPPTAGTEVHRPDKDEPSRKNRVSLHAGDCDRPVLKRLPQRLEGRAVELRELVQEEDAAVRERRLAGTRPRTSADDGRRRRGVVRGAERGPVDERPAGGEQAGNRVNTGYLERLLERQLREDPWQPSGEHRFSRPGRARHQKVVPARRRQLESASSAFLAAHVGEVGTARSVAPFRRADGARLESAAQVGARLSEVFDRNRLDPGQSSLRRRLGGTDEPVEAGPARRLGGDERAGHGSNAAVQRKLPERGVLGEPLGGDLVRRSQHRQRDRKIEAGPFLPQPRRREVDRQPPERPLELRARDPAPNPLLCFLAGLVRKADDRERGYAALEVRLDLDGPGFQSDKSMGGGPRKHTSKLRRENARNRHSAAPRPHEIVTNAASRSTFESPFPEGEVMRRGLFIVALVAALIAVPAAYALLNQHGVKTSGLYEQLPAAATDGTTQYFAWTQNSRSHRSHFDAFLTRTSDPRVKLNATGEGFIGGIDPPNVVYQQIRNGQSNLKLYNADTQTRSDPPAGVNTADWEWEPSISGNWLFFARQTSSSQFVILHSLTTTNEVILDQRPRFSARPGR